MKIIKLKKLTFLIALIILIFINTYCFAENENITIYSESAILIDSNTGRILYEKNSEEKKYPASTTKILTAILTLENCNLEDTVTASYEAISQIKPGYSNASIQIGEELTVEQLLNVLLVHSANDAANVLAEFVGGSMSSFSSMMNTKANQIGCTNTHFINPSGIHDDNHYTTAHDLALITQYCMKNETFRSIVSKTVCKIPATNKHDERTYTNTNELIIDTKKKPFNYYEYAIGVKTGYTSQAKHCLISASVKDNLELICVILGADKESSGLAPRYEDSKNLYEFAYNNYSLKNIASKNSIVTSTTISNGNKDTRNLDILLEDDVNVLIANSGNIENIAPEIILNDNLSAPITSGSVVGIAKYNIDGIEYEQTLIASHDVIESKMMIKIFEFFFILIILSLLLTFFSTRKKAKRKIKRRKNRN